MWSISFRKRKASNYDKQTDLRRIYTKQFSTIYVAYFLFFYAWIWMTYHPGSYALFTL